MDVIQDPDLPLESLLPLRSIVVTLQARADNRLPFFHQAPLTAFLRELAGSPSDWDQRMRLDTPECGRVSYRRGDYYRFMVIGLAGAEPLLQGLMEALHDLPDSAPRQGEELRFGSNWQLASIQDAFTEEALDSVAGASVYSSETLAQEVALWLDHTALRWSWVAPARLLKPQERREGMKEDARFCRDAADLDAPLLLRRLFESTNALFDRRGAGKAELPRIPSALVSGDVHAFWVDHAYTDARGKSHPMGGLSGRIDLRLQAPLSPAWWRLLVLGQYLGIGQRTGFGWGRYRLRTAEGGSTYRRCLPASSVLMLADELDNLSEAWRHVVHNVDLPPWLEVSEGDEVWEDAIDDEDEPPEPPTRRLSRDLKALLEGSYQAPELRGYLLPKANGSFRPLAVPPLYDRVLQRSLVQVLTPALDMLMSRSSHGFRHGHSRHTARYDIQAAWRSGYRWVFESDVDDFFDSVSLQRLEDRLRGLYDEDPAVDAILAWMRAPVRYHGELIERRDGLPQGAPLSPLMANLMLDDFDSDMEQAGFHLIRFADDFVILCRDPQEARAAGEAARASLAEHGLSLNAEKTRVVAMEDGFRYLGYLFVNDLALDVGGRREGALADAPPPRSWLAHLAERPFRELDRDGLQDLLARLASGRATPVGERGDEGALLAVTGARPCVLSTAARHLRVHREERLLHDIPWSHLQAVLLLGNHQLTTQAMAAALQAGVPVHFASTTGAWRGTLWTGRPEDGHELWLRQIAACQDPARALDWSRQVVASRLRHMRETLRQRQLAGNLLHLDRAIAGLHRADNLDSLRGQEGLATREYYERLARVVPEELGFDGRNRRPPRDPFNALLSLGYTVLYGLSDSVLRAVGLLPWVGFYHQPHGTHATLASDLMEPFRHLVERSALTLLLRREIGESDFSQSPAGASRMTDVSRRKYLTLLMDRFETTVRAHGEADARKVIDHLHRQALSLKAAINGAGEFQAWRLR